jgi:hypothetical protein
MKNRTLRTLRNGSALRLVQHGLPMSRSHLRLAGCRLSRRTTPMHAIALFRVKHFDGNHRHRGVRGVWIPRTNGDSFASAGS